MEVLAGRTGQRHHFSGAQLQTHPDGYRLAITNAGCSPDRLLMVAAHAWDLRGAQAVGMRTAYVERPVGDPPSAMDSFDLHAKGLDDLATSLKRDITA